MILFLLNSTRCVFSKKQLPIKQKISVKLYIEIMCLKSVSESAQKRRIYFEEKVFFLKKIE